MRLGAIALAFMAIAFGASATAAAERVALVVGNASYKHSSTLKNPSNDAADLAAALRTLGFEVLVGTDLTGSGMKRLLRDFREKVQQANIALFFYAGHGLQIDGRNYLVPVDAEISKDTDVSLEAIDLGTVMQQMESYQRTSLVFLDACRNNPFMEAIARSDGRSRNISKRLGRGFARVQAGAGTMIAFSTAPDTEADDGDGRNSPFTKALLEHIGSPGLDVALVMRKVRADVINSTDHKQIPWEHSSLTDTVMLVPASLPPSGTPTNTMTASLPAPREYEAQCDEAAGFRSDPDRPQSHNWQADYSTIPAGATSVCRTAFELAQDNKTRRRMLVQLGRSYAALGREAAAERNDFNEADGHFKQARRHWEQAAELNSGQAHNVLGAYVQGSFSIDTRRGAYLPVKQDLATAYSYYMRAADLGNPTGLTNVGLVLVGVDDRFGVPLDFRKGLFYLDQASKLGMAGAFYGIGVAKIRGSGVDANEQAGVHDIAIAYCKNDRRAHGFFERSRTHKPPVCVGEQVARIDPMITATSLPQPKAKAGGPLEVIPQTFDGHWYSPEWKYSYQLRRGVGTATSTNSSNFKLGDVILRIRATGPNTFAGEQIYRDGRWYKISGSIQADGRLHINGEKNVSWAMERIR